MDPAILFRWQFIALGADLVLLVLLAVRLVAGAGRRPARVPWAGLGAVFLLGLGLRLLVAPHTLVHENAHGYEYLRSAFGLEGYFYHGAAYPLVFHLVSRVAGTVPEAVFCANAVLGALAAVLLAPLGWRLLASRQAGWIAAVALAAWPASLRIGASESMFPLAIATGLAAWFAWLRAWDTGRPAWFLAAAGLVAFCVQTRPVMALWPVVLLLSLPACPGWRRRLRTAAPWASLGLAAVLAMPWLLFRIEELWRAGLHGAVRLAPGDFLAGFFSQDNLLLRPDWTPVVSWVLAACGLGTLALRARRALPALVLGFLVMAWMVMGVRTGLSSSLRLQSPLALFYLMWCGLGAARIADWSGPRRRFVVAGLAGLMLVAASLGRAPRVRRAHNPQREYAFLEKTVPALPGECAIVTADRFMADRVVSTEFPAWWAGGRPVVELTDYLDHPGMLDDWPCHLFYRGVSCYCFTHAERERIPADGLRPACRRIERRFELVPLVQQSFVNRPYTSFRVPAAALTIGFYRIAKPRPGDRGDQGR